MTKLLDWERALENADGSEELLIELAQVFVESCPEMMAEVRAAIDRGDAPALYRAAHNIKGSARIFAAGAVMDEALRLEEMGADAKLGGANESWEILDREVDQLIAALGERIGHAGAGQKKGM